MNVAATVCLLIITSLAIHVRSLTWLPPVVTIHQSSSTLFSHSSRPTQATRPINPIQKERTVVIMYHKPKHVITSHSNSDTIGPMSNTASRPNVYDEIMSMKGYISKNSNHKKQTLNFAKETRIYSKLHAVGRLDADSSGLLLLTNDGLLVHAITNPNAKLSFAPSHSDSVTKTYLVRAMGYHTHPHMDKSTSSEGIAKLIQGLQIPHHGKIQALDPVTNITILSHDPAYYQNLQNTNTNTNTNTTQTQRLGTCTWLHIVLTQGKNRQVRNMFHAIQSGVMFLHRIAIGNIILSDATWRETKHDNKKNHIVEYHLEPGQWRVLTEEEVWLGFNYPSRTLGK